jgi:hypothetical protein
MVYVFKPIIPIWVNSFFCCHLAVPMTHVGGPQCSQIWPFGFMP